MTTYECYVCKREATDVEMEVDGVRSLLKPLGWEKDANGRDRCPRHVETGKPLTTLGEMLRAKQRVRRT